MSEEAGLIHFKLLSETGSDSRTYFVKDEEIGNISGELHKRDKDGTLETNGFLIEDGEQIPEILREGLDNGNFSCKPLQEIDSRYLEKQTFLVVGRNGILTRCSKKPSPFILNPSSRIRKLSIYICSRGYLPILIGILLVLFSICLAVPEYLWNLTSFIRYFVTVILLIELFINVLARGIWVDEFTFLKKRADWLDLFVVTVMLLCFGSSNPILHSFQGFALLKLIPIVPGLIGGICFWVSTVRNLVPVLIYSLLISWVFVVVGFNLENFSRSLCFFNEYRNMTNYNDQAPVTHINYSKYEDISYEVVNYSELCNFSSLCPVGVKPCTNSSILLSDIVNNFSGLFIGKFFGSSLNVRLFHKQFVYYASATILSTLSVFTLSVAAIYKAMWIFHSSRNLHKPTSVIIMNGSSSSCNATTAHFLSSFCHNSYFEFFTTIIIILDIILMALEAWKLPAHSIQWTFYGQKVFLVFYLIEVTLKLVISPLRYLKNPYNWLDISVAVLFLIDLLFHPLRLLLLIRLFKITPAWPSLCTIMKVFLNTLTEHLSILGVIIIAITILRICDSQMYHGDGLQMQTQESLPSVFDAQNLSDLFPSFVNFPNQVSIQKVCNKSSSASFCTGLNVVELLIGVLLVNFIVTLVIFTTVKVLKSSQVLCPKYLSAKEVLRRLPGYKKMFNLLLRYSLSEKPNHENGTDSSKLNGGDLVTITTELHDHLPLPPATVNEGDGIENNVSIILPKLENWISRLVIGMALVGLIMDFDKSRSYHPQKNPRLYLDGIFTMYFLCNCLWKGIWKNGFGIIKCPYFLCDFITILVSLFCIYIGLFSKVQPEDSMLLKYAAILASLRCLMLISRFDRLKATVLGILDEVRVIWNFGCASLFILWFFWLFHVTLNDSIDGDKRIDRENVHSSIEKVVAHFFTALLIGIICGVLLQYSATTNGFWKTFLSNAQLNGLLLNKSSIKGLRVPYPKNGLCIQVLHYVTQTNAFQITIILIIVCDCLIITVGQLANSHDWRIVWKNYPYFIIFIYFCEIIMKILAWRKFFFKSFWNVWDILIVSVGILDLLVIKVQIGFITAELIRFFRIFSILNAELMGRASSSFFRLCGTMKTILPALLNHILLYIIISYMFVTIWMTHSRRLKSEIDYEVISHFQSVAMSLLLIPIVTQKRSCETDLEVVEGEFIGFEGCDASNEIFILLYSKSYFCISYFIVCNIFMMFLCEILSSAAGEVDLERTNYANVDSSQSTRSHMYKTINGTQESDFIDSIETSGTSGIRSFSNASTLECQERYPEQISANGYIVHVEAFVTTV